MSYTTEWKSADKGGSYTTKKLTRYHRELHQFSSTVYAKTTASIPGELGGFLCELVAVTDRNNPKNNKPFPPESPTVSVWEYSAEPEIGGCLSISNYAKNRSEMADIVRRLMGEGYTTIQIKTATITRDKYKSVFGEEPKQ